MNFDNIMLSISNLFLFCWGISMHIKTKALTEEAKALRSDYRETTTMLMEENVRRLARNTALLDAIIELKKSVAEAAKTEQKK